MSKRMSHTLLIKRLDVQKMYIDENGKNLFKTVLKEAIAKERKYYNVSINLLDGKPSQPGFLTHGQETKKGRISVEYHNRW